jgi:hypothetical protein
MPQNTHCSAGADRLCGDRQPVESEGCSGPVDVMVPFVVVAIGCRLNELSGLGEAVDGRPRAGTDELLRFPIFLFRSSRRSDLRGETLNTEKYVYIIILLRSSCSFLRT